jgi:hypothetical protein
LQSSINSSQSSSSGTPPTRAKSNSDSIPTAHLPAPTTRVQSSTLNSSSSSQPETTPNQPSEPNGAIRTPMTVSAPSGGYNKRPASGGTGALKFGNTSDSPARGMITLYSNRVVPSPELLGWKPQFSLEHTFRKPTMTRSVGTSSSLPSSTSSVTPGYPLSVQNRPLSNSASAGSAHYSPMTHSGNVNPSYPLPLYSGQSTMPTTTHSSNMVHSGSGRAIGHSGTTALQPVGQHGQPSPGPYSAPVSPSYPATPGAHGYNVSPSGSYHMVPGSHGSGHVSLASSAHHTPNGHKHSSSAGSSHSMSHGHAGLSHSVSNPHSPQPTSYHYPPQSGYNSLAGSSSTSGGTTLTSTSSGTSYTTPVGYPPSGSNVYYAPPTTMGSHYNPTSGPNNLKLSYPPSTGPISPTYAPLSPTPSDYPKQPYYPPQSQQSSTPYHAPSQSQQPTHASSQYTKPLPKLPAPSYNKPLPAVPTSNYKDATPKAGYPPTY